MKSCFFFSLEKRRTVCCCSPLQWRGTSWYCRNAIYWEGPKWAMSGRQASTALIVSVPLTHSGRAAAHFLPRASAYSPKPRTNTTFIFRHNGALPTRHEIAFYYKTCSDMKESTQSEVIWMWSKIDLKCTLMAWDTYRRRSYYNMTRRLPPEDFVAYSTHTHTHRKHTEAFFVFHAIIKKFRWWSDDRQTFKNRL